MAGLDPYPGRLPEEIASRGIPELGKVREFCLGVLEAVEAEVAAVKLQAAFFERLGPPGMEVYRELVLAAEALDLPVIADVKRGDVRPVAAAYAEAHLSVYGATCVTVNPYMGADAIEPFLEETRRADRGGGVFCLVATSNPSAKTLQAAGEPPLFERAARLVAELGQTRNGGRERREYPDAGAVVGATRPEVGLRVRALMPDALFLVPGFGAQGGSTRGIASMLDREGRGVLVNSSRGLSYAYESAGAGADYRLLARHAARDARRALHEAGVRP